jgi:S1-C subfamily serine protease
MWEHRSNLNKIVIVLALISVAIFVVISLISSHSYNAEAQTFDNNDNNLINSTLLPELFTKVKQSVVTVNVANTTDPSDSSSGSGFIYDNDGHILTTMSAVAAAADITGDIHITFSDETVHRAKVIGSDSFTDLAVLRVQDVVPKDKLIPLPLGNSSELRVGEQAITIASPFGISGLLTEGVISGLGVVLPSELEEQVDEEPAPSFSIPDIIVTDVPTNPGSAGGPLLNIKGEVIGINNAIYSSTGEFAGISFALASNTIRKVVPSLIATGSYTHPYIGITGIDITPEIAEAIGLTEARGFLVTDATAEGPAAKAGIQGSDLLTDINGREIELGGDVILEIDNKTVSKIDDILTHLEREKQPGDSVKLTVLRDGQLQEMNAIVGSRPSQLSPAAASAATSDILTYENGSYGIEIQYPANWTKDEEDTDPSDGITDIVEFSSPFESRLDSYSETLGISIEELTDQNMTLEEYASSLITAYNETFTDFNLIESNTNSTLAEKPAYKLVYTETLEDEDSTNLKTMETGTIIGERVYFIEYIAEEEKYSNYLPIIQMMINSIEIT